MYSVGRGPELEEKANEASRKGSGRTVRIEKGKGPLSLPLSFGTGSLLK